jgi:hypothetical protein
MNKFSLRFCLLIAITGILLGGCSQRGARSHASAADPFNDPAIQAAMQRMKEFAEMPAEQARALIANQTSLTYDFGMSHGNQIEFNAADGNTYLWYPGNKIILKGLWEVRRQKEQTVVCFAYGENTYNPATGTHGGSWECEALGNYFITQIDRKEGDVFGISKRVAVPHVLDRNAVRAYSPNKLPADLPYLTNGKSPIEHLQEDFAKLPPQS